MTIVLITRRLNNLNLLLKQLMIAVLHLRRRNAKGELYTRRIGMFLLIIWSSSLAKREQNSADPHFNPTFPVAINGKAKGLMVEGLHLRCVITEQDNIIEIANIC